MSNKFIKVTNTEVTLTIPISPTQPGEALMSAILLAYLTQAKPQCPCGKPNCAVKAMDRLWGLMADEGAPFVASTMAKLVAMAAADKASKEADKYDDAIDMVQELLKQTRQS